MTKTPSMQPGRTGMGTLRARADGYTRNRAGPAAVAGRAGRIRYECFDSPGADGAARPPVGGRSHRWGPAARGDGPRVLADGSSTRGQAHGRAGDRAAPTL